MRDEKPIQLTGVLESATPKAYLFQADSWDKAEWLPKSQCTWCDDPDFHSRRGVMTISAWLAGKNGWSEV